MSGIESIFIMIMPRKVVLVDMFIDEQSYIIQETLQEMRYPNVTWVAMPLLRLTPRRRGSSGTISAKFCSEVRGWLNKRAKK